MTQSERPRTPASTRELPLRWGDHATRLWLGGWLLLGGGMAIAGSQTDSLWVLTIGTIAHVAGWCVLPAAGWRRTLAVAPGTLAMWLLLTGPRFVFVLVLPSLLWLLVRHRPPIALLTTAPVAVAAVLVGNTVGQDYSRMLPSLAIVGTTMVACAWAAAGLDRVRARR